MTQEERIDAIKARLVNDGWQIAISSFGASELCLAGIIQAGTEKWVPRVVQYSQTRKHSGDAAGFCAALEDAAKVFLHRPGVSNGPT